MKQSDKANNETTCSNAYYFYGTIFHELLLISDSISWKKRGNI